MTDQQPANEEIPGEGEEEKEKVVEEPVEVEQEVEEEEESILTEYDADEFFSGAVLSENATIPEDLFEFAYSFGYNCHKYFNLCACDDLVVCWSAGSIITFFDVNTKQTWFRRSTTGGTVGNIICYRKDPNYRLAIAECGEGEREPLILLYTWPDMQLDAVLRDGTANAYSILDFSPDGEMLASVGREPDYNLTIWNWKRHKILLRTSAFTYDVNAVMFSPYCPGQLTTAGAAHIKFWKMAETFTGLKLKGDLGRFGKTEICDVLGVYPMPDENVLSGCEWGNILVWEAGLVKVEVTQKARKFCHKAPVVQFMLSDAHDEVTTIARDGCVRAWYWDTVDQADPPEDDPYIEVNPVAETCVPDCQIMCLKHQKDMFWFAQDGNGGIWVVELEIDKIECEHKKVLACHAGGIVGMAALRSSPILITAGEDGALQAYHTESYELMARYTFPKPVTCLFYPPLDMDKTSCIIIAGFGDGIMRTLLIHPEAIEELDTMLDVRVHSDLTIHSHETKEDIIDMISLLKPHSKALTQITINESRTLLVTCGEDRTIFMYKLILSTPFKLERLGFINTPIQMSYMTWKPGMDRVLLLCGQFGYLMEAVLPDVEVQKYTSITTFKLDFESFKETTIKQQSMRHRPFPQEEDLASIDEEALKARDEAKDDDEEEEEWIGEIQLIESEKDLGTTITWAEYCNEGVWIIQEGTGALLLVQPGSPKILKYAPLPGAWEDNITALKFVCDHQYLLVGMHNGYIRMLRMPTVEEDSPEQHLALWLNAQMKLLKQLKGRRLAKEETQPIPRIDFNDHYYLPMHDRYTGAIVYFDFSDNGKKMYTCGSDGNIFAFHVNFPLPLIPEVIVPPSLRLEGVEKVPEPSTVDGELMSHEQLKQKEEYDKMMAIANAHKKRVRDDLSDLTFEYNKVIKANKALPVSQQIDVTLDPRPLEVQEQELNQAKALTIRKLAYQLEASELALKKMYNRNIIMLDVFPFVLKGIRDPTVTIRPLRQKNLSQAFYDQLDEVYQKMAEAALRGRREEAASRRLGSRKTTYGPPRVASFLLGLPPKPPHSLTKAIRNYHARLTRHHIQFIEWQEHLALKPDPNALPPGAMEALKEAEATIGNRLLKTQSDYIAPPGHNTQLRVCNARKEIYDNKREFNEKVLELRQHKLLMVKKMREIGERLGDIRVEIPPKMVKPPPPLPDIDEDLEFPERNLEIRPELFTVPSKPMSKKGMEMHERRRTGLTVKSKPVRVPRFVPLIDSRPLVGTWELIKHRQDMESTPLEIEVRQRRIKRHLYEQDMLLAEADVIIDEYDDRLKYLQRERIRVQEKNQLLELHLYQLHREMNVLNRFEAHEDRLAEKVYVKLMQVRGVADQILDCEHRIIEHQNEKENLDAKCQEIQRDFKKLVGDNKFADFLRRIFKKKYKPPRIRDDDESSESESSSSSSEEEDEGSLDSRDIGPIRLDPNVCPEGCEQEIFDKTYEMRNTRHKFEQDMMEQDRLVELLRRDIDGYNKIKRKLSLQLDQRKSNLREFMLEKQNCMNDVDQVVILRYDQIRASAIRGCTDAQGLSQTVVFPEATLQRLRRRVLELQDEIRQQKLRHKVNRTHLFRMNVDLRAMEESAAELRAKMRDVLTRKLGKPRRVDRTLDDLLRQMARRHKYSVSFGVPGQVQSQITEWRKRHSTLEQQYLRSLNEYSDRLRLAAALQSDIFPRKPQIDAKKIVGGYEHEEYQRDVVRLRIIRQQQRQQIKQLREEIYKLRLKPLTPMTLVRAQPPLEEVPSDINLKIQPEPKRHYLKYFPITPLGSENDLVYSVNLTRLAYDCLDSMRISRESAKEFMQDITDQLPGIMSGATSQYDVIGQVACKWLAKTGGDPKQYKNQTRVFDTIAILFEQLIQQQTALIEKEDSKKEIILSEMEVTLKEVFTEESNPFQQRLGFALATLLHTANISQVETAETMAMLVKSLLDDVTSITAEFLDEILITEVVADIKEYGIYLPDEELLELVILAVESLRAQIVDADEAKSLAQDVADAMRESQSKLSDILVVDGQETKTGSKAVLKSTTSLRSTASKRGLSRSSVRLKTSKSQTQKLDDESLRSGSEESASGDLVWDSQHVIK